MAAINRQEKMILRNINNKNDPQKKHRLGMVSKNIFTVGLNLVHGANLTFNSDVDQDAFGKVTKHNTHDSQIPGSAPALLLLPFYCGDFVLIPGFAM